MMALRKDHSQPIVMSQFVMSLNGQKVQQYLGYFLVKFQNCSMYSTVALVGIFKVFKFERLLCGASVGMVRPPLA